jgi:hypothetical protein
MSRNNNIHIRAEVTIEEGKKETDTGYDQSGGN